MLWYEGIMSVGGFIVIGGFLYLLTRKGNKH